MDGTGGRGLARPLKAAVAALALAGLLALVALAARSGHPTGHGRLHRRDVPAWVANDLLTILVIVYALAAITVVIAFMSLRDDWKPSTGRSWMRQLLLLAIILAALAVLGYRLERNLHTGRRGSAATLRTQATGTARRVPTLPNLPHARRPAQFDWVFAATIGGGLLLLAAVMLARRRRVTPDEVEETVEEELAGVVSDAIDDLRGEADPRRAVIAAYARMERVLGQHGHPRHRSEAPFEYLSRILTRLRVRPAAVQDLTELFERAKFSTHEIDAAMKERAIAALIAVRHDLEAVPA